MCKFSLIYVSLLTIFLSACSSTEIKKLSKKEYAPLAENVPVKAIFDVMPSNQFEKICKIKIEKTLGPFQSDDPKRYAKELKAEARKCGADTVMVSRSLRYGDSFTITAHGIRITSEGDTIKDKNIKKLALAIDTNNTEALRALLAQVNPLREMRSRLDNLILDTLLVRHTKKGLHCDREMSAFFSKYDVLAKESKTNYLNNKLITSVPSDQSVIYCGSHLRRTYAQMDEKHKLSFATNLNNNFVQFAKYVSLEKSISQKLEKYRVLFEPVLLDIKSACQKDATSELCILKSNIAKLHGAIIQVQKKVSKSQKSKTQLDKLKKSLDMNVI